VLSPLVEVYVFNLYISYLEMERLLEVFRCQPLRNLILFELPDLDIRLLKRIVTTFPQLEEILLFTGDTRVPWPGGLVRHSVHSCMMFICSNIVKSKIADILQSLRNLHTLEWNYIENDCHEAGGLLLEFRRIVPVVADRCPQLTRLKFSSYRDGDYAAFHIHRDALGKFERYDFQGWHLWHDPCTSAWNSSKYNHL
jgi:hypothetical protein